MDNAAVFPANLYLAPKDVITQVLAEIQDEMAAAGKLLQKHG